MLVDFRVIDFITSSSLFEALEILVTFSTATKSHRSNFAFYDTCAQTKFPIKTANCAFFSQIHDVFKLNSGIHKHAL